MGLAGAAAVPAAPAGAAANKLAGSGTDAAQRAEGPEVPACQ